MTNYNNIENGISVISTKNSMTTAIISTITKADLKLSMFHMLMFLYGAKLYVESIKEQNIDKSILELYMRLNEKVLENNSEDYFTFDKKQLIFLQNFLVARLNHCEIERDNRSPKFNADTYISMKLMLLDIKELLLGAIIEVIEVIETK
jgi:hypothetical protein